MQGIISPFLIKQARPGFCYNQKQTKAIRQRLKRNSYGGARFKPKTSGKPDILHKQELCEALNLVARLRNGV
jgi:hypothetical protein